MSYKKSLLYALNATCRDFPIDILIFPGIFLLFCMAVCDYVRVSCHSNSADSECVLLNDCDKRNQGTYT